MEKDRENHIADSAKSGAQSAKSSASALKSTAKRTKSVLKTSFKVGKKVMQVAKKIPPKVWLAIGIFVLIIICVVAATSQVQTNSFSHLNESINPPPDKKNQENYRKDLWTMDKTKEQTARLLNIIAEYQLLNLQDAKKQIEELSKEKGWDYKRTLLEVKTIDLDGNLVASSGNVPSKTVELENPQEIAIRAESYIRQKVKGGSYGFALMVYEAFGIDLKSDPEEMRKQGKEIKNLTAGDLIHFGNTKETYTCGIYDGAGYIYTVKNNIVIKKKYNPITEENLSGGATIDGIVPTSIKRVAEPKKKESDAQSPQGSPKAKPDDTNVVREVWDLRNETGGRRGFFSYTGIPQNWTAGTRQHKLYSSTSVYLDNDGFSRFKGGGSELANKDSKNDYYIIALGSFFGSEIGAKYKLTFEKGNTIYAILGDQKANVHTDSSNKFTKGDGSWVEVHTRQATDGKHISPSARPNSPFTSKVVKIERIDGNFVENTMTGGLEANLSTLRTLAAYSISIDNLQIKPNYEIQVRRDGSKYKAIVGYQTEDKKKFPTKNWGNEIDLEADLRDKLEKHKNKEKNFFRVEYIRDKKTGEIKTFTEKKGAVNPKEEDSDLLVGLGTKMAEGETISYGKPYIYKDAVYSSDEAIFDIEPNAKYEKGDGKITNSQAADILAKTTFEVVYDGKPESMGISSGANIDPTGELFSLPNPKINSFQVTAPYGYSSYHGTTHLGLDIAMPMNTPLYAAVDGEVTITGSQGTAGIVVVVKGKNLTTKYFHMSQSLMRAGDKVKMGQIVGYSGNTGNSSGPHLHLEIWKDGKHTSPVPFLKGKN